MFEKDNTVNKIEESSKEAVGKEQKMDKLELYRANTPYDLAQDLTEDEKKVLGKLLGRMAEKMNNADQQKFLQTLKDCAGIETTTDTRLEMDDVESNLSEKIIMQVLMEYGSMADDTFEFMGDEIFDDFSVDRKAVRLILSSVKMMEEQEGFAGIIEKYELLKK